MWLRTSRLLCFKIFSSFTKRWIHDNQWHFPDIWWYFQENKWLNDILMTFSAGHSMIYTQDIKCRRINYIFSTNNGIYKSLNDMFIILEDILNTLNNVCRKFNGILQMTINDISRTHNDLWRKQCYIYRIFSTW